MILDSFAILQILAIQNYAILKDTNSHITMSIKKKEKLNCKIIFPSLLKRDQCNPVGRFGVAYQIVTKNLIYKALIIKSISKLSRLKEINSCILRML